MREHKVGKVYLRGMGRECDRAYFMKYPNNLKMLYCEKMMQNQLCPKKPLMTLKILYNCGKSLPPLFWEVIEFSILIVWTLTSVQSTKMWVNMENKFPNVSKQDCGVLRKNGQHGFIYLNA